MLPSWFKSGDSLHPVLGLVFTDRFSDEVNALSAEDAAVLRVHVGECLAKHLTGAWSETEGALRADQANKLAHGLSALSVWRGVPDNGPTVVVVGSSPCAVDVYDQATEAGLFDQAALTQLTSAPRMVLVGTPPDFTHGIYADLELVPAPLH